MDTSSLRSARHLSLAGAVLSASVVPAAAETVDMNKVHEQWGIKTDEQSKFWADDPKTYAAAQQVDQRAVSGSWFKKLIILVGVGAVAFYVFLKSRD